MVLDFVKQHAPVVVVKKVKKVKTVKKDKNEEKKKINIILLQRYNLSKKTLTREMTK